MMSAEDAWNESLGQMNRRNGRIECGQIEKERVASTDE